MRRISILFFLLNIVSFQSFALDEFKNEQAAQNHCPGDSLVWVNLSTGEIHYKGQDWYARTKRGVFVCQKDAEYELIPPRVEDDLYGDKAQAKRKEQIVRADAKCKSLLLDKRLNSIRGKISLDDKPLESLLNRYPTKLENEALAVYSDISWQCWQDWNKARGLSLETSSRGEFESLLTSLRDGKLTYAEYAIEKKHEDEKADQTLKSYMSKLEADAKLFEAHNSLAVKSYEEEIRNDWPNQFKSSNLSIRKFTDYAINIAKKVDGGEITSAEGDSLIDGKRLALNRQFLEADADKKRDKRISCIFESPKNIEGVEIQYLFNESSNTLLVSHGSTPENVSINDKEITYHTVGSDATGAFSIDTSIRRDTGRFTMEHHGSGGFTFVFSGSCHMLAAQKS